MKKRFLISVLLAALLCLMAGTAMAAAPSNVRLGGIYVRSGFYLAENGTEAQSEKPTGDYAYFHDGILELHGFSASYSGTSGTATVYADGDLTIQYSGANTLSFSSAGTNYVINVDGDLTLEGTSGATLYASTGNSTGENDKNCAIMADSITVQGAGTITAVGGKAVLYSYGVKTDKLVMQGTATLKATGGARNATTSYNSFCSYGIWAQEISIAGGTVNATGGASGMTSNGIFCRYLENSGSLTAKGAAAVESYGVECIGSLSDGRKGVVMNGGTLTATASAGVFSCGLQTTDFTLADGTVTATAGQSTGTNDYCTPESTGLKASLALTVSGGSLTAASGSSTSGRSNYGIWAGDGITMTGGTVNGTSKTSYDNWNWGVYSYGPLVVSGGSLTGTGATNSGTTGGGTGVYAVQGCTISGTAKVTATAPGTSTEYTGLELERDAVLTICGTAEVKADAGVGIYLFRGDLAVSDSADVTADGLKGVHVYAGDLTMDGGTLFATGTDYAVQAINITLNGTADVTAYADGGSGSYCAALKGDTSVAIGGSARVDARAYGTTAYSATAGVHTKSFTMNSAAASLTAKGGNHDGSSSCTYGSCGLYLDSEAVLNMSAGSLTAIGGDSPSYSCGILIYPTSSGAANSSVSITGGSITAEGGDGKYGYGIRFGRTAPFAISGGETLLTGSTAASSLAPTLTSMDVTASAAESGTPVTAYDAASITGYKYLLVEPEVPDAITDIGNGMVNVSISTAMDAAAFAQLMAEVGDREISLLCILESGELNAPGVKISALRVDNYGKLLGGDLQNTVLHNYGTVDGECDLYDLVNYTGATITGDTEREDGETYYLTYLYGNITNYGTISGVGFSGANVVLNEGTIRVRVTYNDGWENDDGWGWGSTKETHNYGDRVGDVLGEGFYTTSGEYAADMTLGLNNTFYHHWTRAENGNISVKAADTRSPVYISAAMAGSASSIYVAMGQLLTDELTIPVRLGNVQSDDVTYYESWLGGGTFTDVTFEAMATATGCTINGTITLHAAADLRSDVTYGPDACIVVDGTTPEFTNLGGLNHSYPFTYTLPATITQNGVASGCKYTNTVTNNGKIASGTFTGAVVNNGTITGGSFTGSLSGNGSFAPRLTLSASGVEYSKSVRVTSSLSVNGSSWEWWFAESETAQGQAVSGAATSSYTHSLLQSGYVYPVQVIPVGGRTVCAAGDRVPATVPDYTVSDIDSSNVMLVSCNLQDDVINVPAKINGKTVKKIASGAFANCPANATINHNVSSSYVEDGAFLPTQHVWNITGSTLNRYCGPAVQLTLPQNITYIASDAFENCSQLVSLTAEGVTCVNDAFDGCTSLQSVYLPAVTKLEYGAFAGCETLVTFDRGDDPQFLTIGTLAFNRCLSLTGFDFTNVTSMGNSVFASRDSMGTVYLPDCLTSIGSSAFPEGTVICSSATAYARQWAADFGYTWQHDRHVFCRESVPQPAQPGADGVKPALVCSGCGEAGESEQTIAHTRTLFLPALLTEIGEEAFAGTAMQQVTIAQGVTSIGIGAFAGCEGLLLAVVPDSVVSIADDAFDGCDQLLILCTSETSEAAMWAARNGVEYVCSEE